MYGMYEVSAKLRGFGEVEAGNIDLQQLQREPV